MRWRFFTELLHQILDLGWTFNTGIGIGNRLFLEVAVLLEQFLQTVVQRHVAAPVVGSHFCQQRQSLDGILVANEWLDQVAETFFKTEHKRVVVLGFILVNLIGNPLKAS